MHWIWVNVNLPFILQLILMSVLIFDLYFAIIHYRYNIAQNQRSLALYQMHLRSI